MYDLPFADHEFDTVILDDVLGSAADPAAAVREARRLLKPGGRLLLLSAVDAGSAEATRSAFLLHARAAGLRLTAPRALPSPEPRWLLAVATHAGESSAAA
jgi:ubiquinone/menaquinone biosynthesis C-methylase UbiE